MLGNGSIRTFLPSKGCKGIGCSIPSGILCRMSKAFPVCQAFSKVQAPQLAVFQSLYNVADVPVVKMEFFCRFMKYNCYIKIIPFLCFSYSNRGPAMPQYPAIYKIALFFCSAISFCEMINRGWSLFENEIMPI